MRQIRQMLRLHHELGLSARQIGRSLGLNHKTVLILLYKAQAAGLSWPLPEGLTDAELEARLYPPPHGPRIRPEPDFAWVHKELRRKGVTRQLLWVEYRKEHPDGLGYSEFCARYRRYTRDMNVTLRKVHRAGEELFVDYAGLTLAYRDREKGKEVPVQIFVATLGASGYTYCEATASQKVEDFIASHVRAFNYFGGLPKILVPDHLKSAVHKPDRYDPDLSRAYAEMGEYYGLAIVPARPHRPKDKGSVEKAVQDVERQVLAPLRHTLFFSLSAINEAMKPLLEAFNRRPFQKIEGSRRSLYEALDRPALRPLPPVPFELARWKRAQVGPDYHVYVDGRYFSVPYTLCGEKVDIRVTRQRVEVFYRGERVAHHLRQGRGTYTTLEDHMPPHHKAYAEQAQWTPERLVRWAKKVGPSTAALVAATLDHAPLPQQAFRSCLGILRLARQYPVDQVEAAAARALSLGLYGTRGLKAALSALPPEEPPDPAASACLRTHPNVRGPEYYRGVEG